MSFGCLSLLHTTTSANTVEALTAEALALYCSHYEKGPQGTDAVFCERYIQDFIDGAVATD